MSDHTLLHTNSRRKLTDDLLRSEAAKYATRREFSVRDTAAYNTALRRGLLDEICAHMVSDYTFWNAEALAEEALKFASRSEFQKKSFGAYKAARRFGLIDEICAHMTKKHTEWTDDMLRVEALKYQGRAEFQKKANAAYQAAKRRKILDDACGHMEEPTGVDAVYLLKVKGTDIYKIGITASIYGLCRMYQVAEAGGFEPEIVIQTTVKSRPHQVERQVLSLGQPVNFDRKFQGYTEFRRLNDNEVAQAVGIITSNSWLQHPVRTT